MATSGSILGNPVRRKEDPGILTGAHGVLRRPRRSTGLLHVAFVRSTIAHATHRGDRHERRQGRCPASSPCTRPTTSSLPDLHGFMMLPPTMNRPPLAQGQGAFRRRHRRDGRRRDEGAGGRRGRERDRRLRPAARGRDIAGRDSPTDAPVLHEAQGSNVANAMGTGPVEGVLDDADVVVQQRIVNQRVAPVPMEPGGIVVVPGEPAGGFDVLGRVAGSARRARRDREQARARSRGRARRAPPRSAAASARSRA